MALAKTIGELKKSNYQYKSLKQEMRDNLILKLQKGEKYMVGIKGYEYTVTPQLESAILSQHNILLLGLRGQAKTRIARGMTALLDEYIPVVEGSPINDDPLFPISSYAKEKIEQEGDKTSLIWLHRSERFFEKLATPDVSVSDLIGDIDPIKAATLKLSLDNEKVIHYGMVPRANRCIFVINELPDLQARIQVGLFNILEEGDVQIRGFKLRLPVDVQFVFTANPEDYTNRGSIVTPLKDRIQSQILTHYPKDLSIAQEITEQEMNVSEETKKRVDISPIIKSMVEEIAFEARESEYVDQKSGVSARLTISAMENLYSIIERRLFLNKQKKSSARLIDVYAIIHSITGKVELVYEGENEGAENVAFYLINKVVRKVFSEYFDVPKDKESTKQYEEILKWFNEGKMIQLLNSLSDKEYEASLNEVPKLKELAEKSKLSEYPILAKEFILLGLVEYSKLGKHKIDNGLKVKDLLSEMIDLDNLHFDDYQE